LFCRLNFFIVEPERSDGILTMIIGNPINVDVILVDD
jgi:hypothetical protein